MYSFRKFIFVLKLYMFRTVPLSVIRVFLLYLQQLYMSYRSCHTACEQDQDGTGVPTWSCSQAVRKTVWHIPLLCVQWKTPDDGQRNCPKHVEFQYKNKFEKLMQLVGIITRNLSRCTVTLTSKPIIVCEFPPLMFHFPRT